MSGFYIEVSHGQSSKVPDNFKRRQTLTNAERYLTPNNGAEFLKMGGVPDYEDCEAAALSSNQINVNSLPAGTPSRRSRRETPRCPAGTW